VISRRIKSKKIPRTRISIEKKSSLITFCTDHKLSLNLQSPFRLCQLQNTGIKTTIGPLKRYGVYSFFVWILACYSTFKAMLLKVTVQASSSGLPDGWEVRHSNSKNLPYYFNPATKDSRWDPPAGTDTEKLKTYMAVHHSSGIAPSAAQKTDGKIRAAHLLIKHKDSRRPKSWREETITRTKEEAISILLGHEQRIRSGATTLAELATTESDCSSSRKGGDL
jgi:peptidyl-prolyl cis-trans isomerase NIMA-interacting 1